MPENSTNLRALMIGALAGALASKWLDVIWNWHVSPIPPSDVLGTLIHFAMKVIVFGFGLFGLCIAAVQFVDRFLIR